jgi:hypothetical protein
MAARPKLFGLDAKRVVDSELARLLERELARRTDPQRLRRTLAAQLKSGKMLAAAASVPVRRLEALLTDLPRLAAQQAARRRTGFAHLFGRSSASRPYLASTEELSSLLKSGAAQDLLKSAQGRTLLDQHGRVLVDQLAGISDRYADLKLETGLFNDLMRLLYPNDYPSLRLDAHHVIEDRAFAHFAKDWGLLGWKSADDMATIPLFYELHIRSPKRIPGVTELGQRLDARSLTGELLSQIDVTAAPNVFALLNTYRGYYARGGITRALPVIDAIEKELSSALTRAKLVQQAKKLKP